MPYVAYLLTHKWFYWYFSWHTQVKNAYVTHDLFGRLLYMSNQEKIDMAKFLTYPLLEFPVPLSHVDGSLMRTDKSQLMVKLESTSQSTPPTTVDVIIVDAMFYLHILQEIPETYGEIVARILEDLWQNK